jgi:tRNA(Ile)-lysidine synthase
MKYAATSSEVLPAFVAAVHANLDRLLTTERGTGVVAVSGGADSVALLRALADSPPPPDLVVAHLNHRLRGTDSDSDAAFVAAICPHLPHRVESVDVAGAAAAEGDNLEAVARRVRYDFLARIARETGATWVATAHTRDDQAETVLHRLIRGSGLRGLRGIAESRELVAGVRLVRPMLTLSRQDVIAYLREIDQPWREDATNRDTRFTRNRIRHELLPVLRTFNPAINEVLSRTAAQANEMYAGIAEVAAAVLQSAERPRAGPVVILDRTSLEDVSTHVLREVLHAIWQREGWPRGEMTLDHWSRAADVARGEAPASDLPAGLRIVATSRVVRIGLATELKS